MERHDRLDELITPTLTSLGYELVRVRFGGERQPILQIMAERADRRNMTVEDCARISRELSALFETADPIEGAYTLEVSSPGIDRPLMRPDDFERYVGHEAKVELEAPIGGRKRFQGIIAAVEPDGVVIALEGGDGVSIPFGGIKKSKLVLTDRLVAEALRAQSAEAEASAGPDEKDGEGFRD